MFKHSGIIEQLEVTWPCTIIGHMTDILDLKKAWEAQFLL